jgi:hypothetical protein
VPPEVIPVGATSSTSVIGSGEGGARGEDVWGKLRAQDQLEHRRCLA